jgi:hypothetical protein
MADNDKRKFDLPWATLLPVAAVLAGIVAQYKPLVSERPSVPMEKTAPIIAAQDVDARLWQDPIGVAQKQKTLLDEKIEKGVAKKGVAESHSIAALSALLHQDASTFPGNVLLLAVMLDAGPYSEQAESRLRARQAVLEGLTESGFVPVDGEHIGFVTRDWPPDSPFASEGALLLPWEQCEAVGDPSRASPPGTRRVLVLWLPSVSFSPYPLTYFASLINQLASDIRDKVQVKLIGPANSNGLQNMVREVRWYRLGPATQEALRGVQIISPRATSSDLLLLSSPDLGTSGPSGKSVSELLENSVPNDPTNPKSGLRFIRTIPPDDFVLGKLIAELARRRIPITPETAPDGRVVVTPAHIVILSEWDTPYGRSLDATFTAEASGQTINDVVEQTKKPPAWIHSYHYLRGIDGRLPGDSGKDNQREQEQKSQSGQNTVAVEATEGLNQSDYLRRLARQMREDNARWKGQDGYGIRAIGLLGADVYDKMMILRALRPEFPAAVFFTNNYDAHFERHDNWTDTHNLVIVSPFGNTLPEIYLQQRIAPFRDNNQTSMYVGTLVATERMSKEEVESLLWQTRIFEIGRHGAYDLSPPWYLWRPSDSKFVLERNYKKNQQEKTWFREWLLAPGVTSGLIIIALSILAMAAWISVSIARRRLPDGGTATQRLKRALVSTIFWLVCGVPVIVFLVALVAQYWGSEEPLTFFSGISIWPTEMVRLIALMLAIFFMFKASFDLRANARRIEAEFSFAPLPLTPFRWRDLGIGSERWRLKESPRTSRFSAEEAWHAYLCRHKFWPRLIRIGILFTLYWIFALTVLQLSPQPLPPARGMPAFKIDAVVFYLAGVGLLLLSFYVVDAIQLNSNFIRMFGREVTKWGHRVVDRSHRSPPLTEEELSAYHEIFFVAQRTKVVAPLIWYPLLVLTLLVVARSSLFDNWTWPPGLMLIIGITAAWALGSAILLRRAAEHLRETALSDLRRFRLLGQESDVKRRTFDELMAEIRDLKTGAFAPLSDQPFVQAVLFPGAGLGLLAVAQRLLGIF